MRPHNRQVLFSLLAFLSIAVAASPGYAAGTASKDTSSAGIALSNSYAGNSWRQQMLKTWKAASQDAISKKIIAKTKIVNANNSAPEQANQIGNLILQGWKAIAIDAASPTALNGVIQQACSAGVVVVVYDSLATAPCAYKVAYDYVQMGRIEAEYVAKRLDGKGNVLEIRGIAGTSVDNDIHKGIVEGFSKYPGIKIVGSVHGNWTQTIAQKHVAGILPTLPKVDAVVTQGGDGWGTYQAFKAAGRDTPLIIMGNRKAELALWKKLSESKDGYKTFSISSAPGVASAAFWVAQQILAGKKVPKTVTIPLLEIDKAQLATWLKVTPDGGVATPVYSQDWTVRLIDANAENKPLPKSPVPNGQ